MKRVGLAIITVSFLAGAYVSVLDARDVNWTTMGLLLGLGVVGVVIVQVEKRRAAQHSETIAENISVINASLKNVIENVVHLDEQKHEINTYDMCHRIDDLLIEDLNAFADARETIGHAYGLQAYADVMSHFAAGERYLNRVWSASADGYIDEVNAYITRAHLQFEEARTALEAAASAQPVGA